METEALTRNSELRQLRARKPNIRSVSNERQFFLQQFKIITTINKLYEIKKFTLLIVSNCFMLIRDEQISSILVRSENCTLKVLEDTENKTHNF